MKWLEELIKRAKDASSKGEVPPVGREVTAIKYVWDVLTILRAPDNIGTSKLKDLTSSRVRGILGMDGFLIFSVRTLPLSKEEVRIRNGLLRDHSHEMRMDHFESHLISAYGSLKALGYVFPAIEMDFEEGRYETT